MSKQTSSKAAVVADAKSTALAIPDTLVSGLGSELRALIADDSSATTSDALESSLLDAVEQILGGSLKVAHLLALLKDVGVSVNHKAINVSIVNVLWLFGTQTDSATEESRWNILVTLVKDVASSGLIDVTVMKTSIEFNLLVAAGLMKDEPAHQKRLVKINTGLVFKQQKYNLLREETEGYSKLSVMLCNEMPVSGPGMTAATVSGMMTQFVTNVFSVVGHFDLEPNRVLDLILDAFEEQPTNLCFVPLIERFRHGSIAHILGFKFTMYHLPRILKPAEAPEVAASGAAVTGTAAGTASAKAAGAVAPSVAAVGDHYIRHAHADITGSDAPQSLYILAAMLVMNNLVDLEDLLPYLRPSVERLGVTLQALESEIAQQAASFGVVSLNSTKTTSGKTETKPNANAAALQLAPMSVDVTAVSKPVASSTARKPAVPAVPIASTGVTVVPAPPAKLKAPVAPAPTAASAANTSPRTASSSTLNRVQSSTKLHGGAAKVDPAAELEMDPAKFELFYDASNLPAAAAVAAEVGEVSESASAKESAKRMFAEGNEIVGLICALLTLRGWAQAKYLLNLLELAGMDPLLVMKYSADLRCAMAALVNWQLEAVYLNSNQYGSGHGFGRAVSILPVVLKASTAGDKTAAKAGDSAPVTLSQKFAAFSEFIGRVPVTQQPQLAQVVSLADFPLQASLLLSYCGYHVREFPGLFARLSRLSRACVRLHLPAGRAGDAAVSTEMEAGLEPVLSLVCNVLLPALSAYQESNPFLAGQVWDILHELPFVQRFSVYDRWYGGGVGKEGLGSKHSEVVLAETVALHGARAELKRLAKENTKQVGRKLARFTQTCPLVVFNHVLSQVEAFDNLIPYMVDTLKFSTELSKDVMAYSLVSQLKKGSNADAKLKKGDTHFSQWFSALTKFIATFYCRYPTTELKGLFNYLLQRLSVGDSLDLLVLKELLGIMGGSETLLEVSPAQLEGLSGGRSLRAEVMGLAAGVVGSKGMITASACKKATGILRDELIGSQTAIPLLLFIAQVRSRLLHDAQSTQLKLISHLYDTAQDVLMQFTEFLVGGAKSLESIAVLMPDLSVLLDEVGLAVPVAFQLVRPLLRAALQSGIDPSAAPAHLQRWHPFGAHITALVASLKPVEMWQHMSQRLFIIFWSLGLYDIRVPVARYEAEIKRLKDRYTEVDNKKLTGTAASLGITPSELSKQVKARETELKQLLQKVADLTDDLVKQKKHVEQIKDIMRSEQDTFFRASTAKDSTSTEEGGAPVLAPEDAVSACITQHLLFQRLLMSPLDAVYCTQFCFLLHEMQTPLFSTLHLLDRTIRTVAPLIFCSTEAEAGFVGYALVDLLQVVNRWQDCDEAAYNAEARGKLGFCFRLPLQDKEAVTSADTAPVAAEDEAAMQVEVEPPGLSQAKFKELSKDWHTRLFSVLRSSFKVKDREYMYIRCGLVLLAKVSEQFPFRAREGDQLIALVQQLHAAETERGDLQIMAKSLLTILKKRADLWLNDSPQRRLAAIKAKAKAEALAKLQAEKAEKAAIAATAKEKDAPPESAVRGRGAASAPTNDLRRDEPIRREPPPVRGTDSRQDQSGRDRRDPPARDFRDGPRDPPRDAPRDFPRDAPRDKDRDARDSRDTREKDFRDQRPPVSAAGGARDSRDNLNDNRPRENSRDRERRGSIGSSSSLAPHAAPASMAGTKRKSGDDDRVERSQSGGNPSSAGDANGGAPPSKVGRRAPTATATSNTKVEEGPGRPAPALSQPGPDRKEKAPEKPHGAGSSAKVDDGSRSATSTGAAPSSHQKESKDSTDSRDFERKSAPPANTAASASKKSSDVKSNGDRESSRDHKESKSAESNAKDSYTAGDRDAPERSARSSEPAPVAASSSNNKRSRDAAELSADNLSSNRRGSGDGNGTQERGEGSHKRHSSATSRASLEEGSLSATASAAQPNSAVAELLAMKGMAGGNHSGRRDQQANLSSLKAPVPQDAKETSKEHKADRPTIEARNTGGSRSQAATDQGRVGPLPGSNSLFPQSGGQQQGSRGSARFDDRAPPPRGGGGGVAAPPVPPGPPPAQASGGKFQQSGQQRGGGLHDQHHDQHYPSQRQQQQHQPPPPQYPPRGGGHYDDYDSYPQHHQGGGNRSGGGGGGGGQQRRQDRR